MSIFTGKTRSWSQVPGATASGTIDLISRTSVAGVLTSFQTLLLEGKKVSSLASEQSSEGLLRQAVENDPNGIGFLSNYQAALGSLNSVAYNGVACNKATATSGQYAGVARFYEVTRGRATSFVGVVHQLDHQIRGCAQDHLQPVDPDQLAEVTAPVDTGGSAGPVLARGRPRRPDRPPGRSPPSGARRSPATCSRGCAIHGPTAAPSARSARCRCSWARA